MRVATIAQIATFERCPCPECRRLDREHPREGYQLGLFPYRIGLALRRPRHTAHQKEPI